MLEGQARLTQSLDLALAEDAHEHAARAFTNLGSTDVINRSLAEADRHLRAGITYCADRDLDTWRLYMTAWLARSLAEQGQYAAAERHVADVTRHPHVAPITQVSVLPVAGVLAARRGRDGTEALDEALAIAVRTGESLRLVPVAAARAEAAWIAGRIAGRGRRDRPRLARRRRASAAMGPGRAELVAAPGRGSTGRSARPWRGPSRSCWRASTGRPPPRGRPWAARCGRPTRWPSRRRSGTRSSAWTSWTSWAPRPCAMPCCATGTPAAWRCRAARGTASRANPAGLTAREAEVLQLLADGLSYAEVAERLVLSEKTVGHHVSAVLRKLGEPTRSRAVAAALRLGVIAPR